MIVSIDAEKAFGKIRHFHDEIIHKLRMEGNFNLIKDIYQKNHS